MEPKQPLWLPRGSIRAILALTLVFAVVAGVFITLATATADTVPAPLAALFVLATVVVNSYFEKRQNAS